MADFKSGFVAIIGRPNVGKSTLLNNVLGEKISIISSKPQTTRNQIRGIFTNDEMQIIFIDTPGVHKPKHELGNFMNKQALNTLKEVDLVLLIVDATQPFGAGDAFLINYFKEIKTPSFLVFNKIDLIKNNEDLIKNVKAFNNEFKFNETYYISATKGENVGKLLEGISKYLETGPMYYPIDQKSDQPETFIMAEIIREKVLHLTHQEIPHSVSVVIERMVREKELLHIDATIYIERTSQKKIIIGKGGQMMKKIGTLARKEIAMLLGEKIYLELWVKIEPDWRNKKFHLQKMGYNLENK